jgi:hypothetical protein
VDPSGANSVGASGAENESKLKDMMTTIAINQIEKQKEIWKDEEDNGGKNQEKFTEKQEQASKTANVMREVLAKLEEGNALAQRLLGHGGDDASEDWDGYKTLVRVRQGGLAYDPTTTNADTQRMQKRLNELGYVGEDGQQLPENGVFDQNTLNAVNQFKEKNHL